MKRPSHGTRLKRDPGGSCQTDESIGSSVKLTNSDTSTATATVTPNWKKKRPMMPLMNAIGTNTATIANVVAITARPISSVPSRAAVAWSLPMPRWRTMFSRTTIASSISRPMHSDSAISVRKLSVKPNAYSAMNVAIDRDRQRQAGDDRAAPAVQEQEHDQHGQQRAFEDRALDAVRRLFSTWSASRVDDAQLDVRRQRASSAPRPRP